MRNTWLCLESASEPAVRVSKVIKPVDKTSFVTDPVVRSDNISSDNRWHHDL